MEPTIDVEVVDQTGGARRRKQARENAFANRRAARTCFVPWQAAHAMYAPWRQCLARRATVGQHGLQLCCLWICLWGPVVAEKQRKTTELGSAVGTFRGHSRSYDQARWWHCSDQLRRAGHKQPGEAIEEQVCQQKVEVLLASEPAAAIWLLCAGLGLRARVVGGARVRCRRFSPGCGVNRRRRGAGLLSVRGPFCTMTVREAQGSGAQAACRGRALVVDRQVTCVRNMFREGALRVADCGTRLGQWRGKCLQVAVLACMRGQRRRAAEAVFRARCGNNDASGLLGTLREGRNFKVVEEVLVRERCYVWVCGGVSLEAVRAGQLHGCWQLGSVSGECLGGLLWLRSGHVVRLAGVGECALLGPGGLRTPGVAPWLQGCAGAPKRRGAVEKRDKHAVSLPSVPEKKKLRLGEAPAVACTHPGRQLNQRCLVLIQQSRLL